MADTYGAAEAGDPTFLAFERARQAGEATLAPRLAQDQQYQSGNKERDVAGLELAQTNAVDKNLADYRASGFGQSGLRAQAEDRIRQDIALRMGDVLSGYQHTSDLATREMEDTLASNAYESEVQKAEARRRTLLLQAESGVGI